MNLEIELDIQDLSKISPALLKYNHFFNLFYEKNQEMPN